MSDGPFRVGVLVSGAGTNLQAILDSLHGKGEVGVVAVASTDPDAKALGRAEAAGVTGRTFALGDYPDRAERDAAVADWLEEERVALVVLAGWMHLLSAGFLDRFPNAVINVHPALLPAFPGLRPIEQAIEYGVKMFGVTVHFVDAGTDAGPVILQQAIGIEGARDPEAVHRLLQPIEHHLLPQAVLHFARGEVSIDPDHARHVVISSG